MSSSFEFLHTPPPASEVVHLASSDDRLLEICDLYGARSFGDAHARCDGIIADKVYDFRLIGIHVFCIFWRDGPSTVKPAFEALHTYLRDHWDEVGPERHRRKVISLGVESLIDNMTSTLNYWQTQGSEAFQSWIDEATRESLEETIESLQRLHELPEEHLSPDVVNVQLPKLTQILRGIQKSLPSRDEATESMDDNEATAGPSEAPQPTPDSKGRAASTPGALPAAMHGEMSAELAMLLKKIQAFETLVEAKRFERAAMVADDIQSAVENFDPRKYFPSLFADFYADLVQNFDQISSFWARRDSADWAVLQQLYDVDLDTFVEK